MENLLAFVNEKLKPKFGEEIISAEQQYDFPVFVVKRDKIVEIMTFLRDDADMGFQFLTTMCGLHYPDNAGHELGVMYQLLL